MRIEHATFVLLGPHERDFNKTRKVILLAQLSQPDPYIILIPNKNFKYYNIYRIQIFVYFIFKKLKKKGRAESGSYLNVDK